MQDEEMTQATDNTGGEEATEETVETPAEESAPAEGGEEASM